MAATPHSIGTYIQVFSLEFAPSLNSHVRTRLLQGTLFPSTHSSAQIDLYCLLGGTAIM
ncbi:hypothetical protein ACRALDRAFT_1064875 [Sodiomyces alcalophilus JCM 7366]|uniref:uncharacterized protein n=1 Tax=Sodiomyces alcalophilus JCM 7366 TaxID=591952 RepID=UPI0039B417D4